MRLESELDDVRIPVRLKLSLVWAALMFFYVYGDYFGLYVPGQLQGMLAVAASLAPRSRVAQSIMLPVGSTYRSGPG